ncbi:MAG TPA: carbonate dehydratase [Anaerolineales bacterium]|nr:carbonate dehydratase [Anaerolineales bacterium]
MRKLSHLFENNRAWVAQMTESDPHFFQRLAGQQSPQILWIGCSDSRVPANQIIGMLPGEVFVHRNVANLVVHTDLNCLSVLQFAVDVLQVRHVVVCGHYGCGGVMATLQQKRLGLVDNWLRHVRDVYEIHHPLLEGLPDFSAKARRLCELNVLEQVRHVCETTILQDAWGRGQAVAVHGWIYDVADGLLNDLHLCLESAAEVQPGYRIAVQALGKT